MDKCPQCGYEAKPTPKNDSALMNEYIDTRDKSTCIMRRMEDRFTVKIGEGDSAKDVEFIRSDVYAKLPKAAATVVPPASNQNPPPNLTNK